MIFAILAIVNLSCAFLSYGMTLGTFTEGFPDMSNIGVSIFFGAFALLVGPLYTVVLIGSLAAVGHINFKLKPLSREQRWEIFKKKYEFLGRDYFDSNR